MFVSRISVQSSSEIAADGRSSALRRTPPRHGTRNERWLRPAFLQFLYGAVEGRYMSGKGTLSGRSAAEWHRQLDDLQMREEMPPRFAGMMNVSLTRSLISQSRRATSFLHR